MEGIPWAGSCICKCPEEGSEAWPVAAVKIRRWQSC